MQSISHSLSAFSEPSFVINQLLWHREILASININLHWHSGQRTQWPTTQTAPKVCATLSERQRNGKNKRLSGMRSRKNVVACKFAAWFVHFVSICALLDFLFFLRLNKVRYECIPQIIAMIRFPPKVIGGCVSCILVSISFFLNFDMVIFLIFSFPAFGTKIDTRWW